MTCEEAIQEGDESVWEDSSDKEEMSFPRTKPKLGPRQSLLTKQIHKNDGGSAMQNVASILDPESRRPRTPDGSRPTSCMRRKIISRETTRSLRKAMLHKRDAFTG